MRWALALCLARVARCSEEQHSYGVGDKVTLWVNRVGPYHNPQETYAYYKLPYCHPDDGPSAKKKRLTMGETLEGHDLTNSGYRIKYGENVKSDSMCSTTLSKQDARDFTEAVREHYWYQMYLDDLPIWGMVGETENGGGEGDTSQAFVFTHRRVTVSYNGPRIIEVNLTSEKLVPVSEGATIDWSYSVHWSPTDKPYEARFDRYLDYDFFEHQIHWFSIFNSFMMVVFLCGLVALILMRTLRNDYAKYTLADDDVEGVMASGAMSCDDAGWKQVHGDVFRAPPHLALFSAMVGTGWQLIAITVSVIGFALLGPLHGDVYEERGEMVTSFIVCYALTSTVAGYTSGQLYKQYYSAPRKESVSRWQQTMLLTVALLPGVVMALAFGLNCVALYYDTSNTVPPATLAKIGAIWLFVSLPLVVAGTMLGRHTGKADFPCRVNSIPRPIPLTPWYASPAFIIPVTGVLPFGSIFIEMYFIFTSFWNYKFYYVYGFMALVFAALLVVTVCTTIVATYFVLNAEDYRWQWTSFLAAGSTSVYVFGYSVYYFLCKTKMSGFLQIVFYFGYMSIFCVAFFLLCGALGLAGSTMFVKRIFNNIKVD